MSPSHSLTEPEGKFSPYLLEFQTKRERKNIVFFNHCIDNEASFTFVLFKYFIEALEEAGIAEQEADIEEYVVKEIISYKDDVIFDLQFLLSL